MENNIAKKILLGISTLIGAAVAGAIYKAASLSIDDPLLIGEGEIISDETEEDRD